MRELRSVVLGQFRKYLDEVYATGDGILGSSVKVTDDFK